MIIGNKKLDFEQEGYIMGILNVTPDSFSDGGRYNDLSRAVSHAKEMLEDGASIIDVGGESTRPGYTQISIEEEINRVVPVIKEIKANFDCLVSIDSYKPEVVEAAIKAGADIINDIWGFKKDERMAKLAAKYDLPVILMHNRIEPVYNDFFEDFISDMKESIDIALKAGVKKENIILDPGVGFAKTLEENLLVTNRLEELVALSYPVLLATSKKSMIGLTLDLDKDNRLEGTIATTVIGAMKGARIFRVHDCKENKRALDMTMAILRSK